MKTFKELGLSKEMLNVVEKMNFKQPTGVQAEAIPLALEGRDLLCESATGSGKTFAFGVSIIERLNPQRKIKAVILTPTRELTEQVKTAINDFSYKNLKIISIYGGVSINPQINDLKSADVVVATPGRLLDHLERKTINLSNIEFFILDEADRMFDMGFIDDVKKIISVCPRNRQTLFFSATLAPDVKDLARKHMIDPVEVSGEKMVDRAKLEQVYYDVSGKMKISLLINLLINEISTRVMVFCNTRRTVDMLAKNLKKNNCDAVFVHGGLSQNKRTLSVEQFNNGKKHILVCTDVAARGLHIENVSHVYNYDLPKDAKEYVHRIGRTARAGKNGKVINLLCNNDHDNFNRILREFPDYEISNVTLPENIDRVEVIANQSRRNFNRNEGNSRFGNRKRRFNKEGNNERENRNFNHSRGSSRNTENSNRFSNENKGSFKKSSNRNFSKRRDNNNERNAGSNRRKSWNNN